MDIKEFITGAKREMLLHRYDLIPTIGERRVALIMGEGAAKYGDRNWESGIPMSVMLNHLAAHLNAYRAGCCNEDHLGKVAVNALMACEIEEKIRTGDLPLTLGDIPGQFVVEHIEKGLVK